jgi:hypothetical protein
LLRETPSLRETYISLSVDSRASRVLRTPKLDPGAFRLPCSSRLVCRSSGIRPDQCLKVLREAVAAGTHRPDARPPSSRRRIRRERRAARRTWHDGRRVLTHPHAGYATRSTNVTGATVPRSPAGSAVEPGVTPPPPGEGSGVCRGIRQHYRGRSRPRTRPPQQQRVARGREGRMGDDVPPCLPARGSRDRLGLDRLFAL